jgi:hypothetical protein
VTTGSRRLLSIRLAALAGALVLAGACGPAAAPAPTPTPGGRAILHAHPPYKGLTDNPAYQWWAAPGGPQPDSWWGRGQTPATLRAQAAAMRHLGAALLRVELPWSFVAPDRPGGAAYDGTLARDPGWPGYRWERWDQIVDAATASGLDLVPEVYYAPAWATGVPTTASGGPNAPPTSPRLYADFVHALVTRYHDRVHYWELGNEPDYPAHAWSAGMPAYVDLLLKPGYQAVKEVDGHALVLMAGLSAETSIVGLYRAGGRPYFDIANFHAYYEAPEAHLAALDHVTYAMRQSGDDRKPVWLTELGWPSHPAAEGDAAASTADPRDAAGERKQAKLFQGVFSRLGGRVQAVFVYQLRDTAVYDAAGHPVKRVYWGLTSGDGSRRKPAYDAFRAEGG